MLSVFGEISLRHFAGHQLRTLSTILGVSLGVAAMVAVRLVVEGSSQSYRESLETLAGKTALQISNGEAGAPAELLEPVRQVRGVKAAVPSVQGLLPLPALAGDQLYLFGIDLLADDAVRAYQFSSAEGQLQDSLLFLAQPDSVALTTRFVERHALAVGDRVEVLTSLGPSTLTIREVLQTSAGPAAVLDGRLALMDLAAAQRLLGMEGRFSAIDIVLDDESDTDSVRSHIEGLLQGRAIVQTPGTEGEAVEHLLRGDHYSTNLAGLLAVLIGVFVILNAMTISVVQRRREMAILRSLGMRRRDVRGLILLEALVIGAIGTALGIPLGFGVARVSAASLNVEMGQLLRTHVAVGAAPFGMEPVIWGIVAGLATAILGAWLPAREALRVSPVEALQRIPVFANKPRAYARLAATGGTVATLGVALWFYRRWIPFDPNAVAVVVTLVFFCSVALVTPFLVQVLARRGEAVLGARLGSLAALAGRNVASRIDRTAVTVSAFTISLAGASVVAALLSSVQQTTSAYLSTYSSHDLFVSSGARPPLPEGVPLDGSLIEQIKSLPGVGWVDPIRTVRISYDGSPVGLVVRDAALYREGGVELYVTSRDPASAVAALRLGEGVLVNESFLRRHHVKLGDVLTLTTPTGPAHLRVAGVYLELFFTRLGVIQMDRALYRRLWHDDRANFLGIHLAAGADREQVGDELRARWGQEHRLFVYTVDELRQQANAIVASALAASFPVMAIAIGIGLVGLGNSLGASVLDRVREFGALRAIGATRRQVITLVVLESGVVGLLAASLAVISAVALAYVEVDLIARDIYKIALLYRFPLLFTLMGFGLAVSLSVAVGYLPGRRAARLKVIDALKYE